MSPDFGIGLAGGIDKDGSRAGELLSAGFASVEFGSVAGDAGQAAMLAGHLRAIRSAGEDGLAGRALVGVGIGRLPEAPLACLAAAWEAGLMAVADVADYVSFNLSAQANRPLLDPSCRPLLAQSLAAVAARRDVLVAAGDRRLPLAIKLPLGVGELPVAIAELALAAGFDRLTVVRPDNDTGFSRLAALAREFADRLPLVVVGGIRDAADVDAARAAGAAGIQVHRLFVEQGAACLHRLYAPAC